MKHNQAIAAFLLIVICIGSLPLLTHQRWTHNSNGNFHVKARNSIVVDSVEIIDYGIYEVEHEEQSIPVKTTANGSIQPITTEILLLQTNHIPYKLGTTFGFTFIINGHPDKAPINVEVIIRHPAFKKTDGTMTTSIDRVPWTYEIGEKSGYMYTLDNDNEMVSGKWSMELWHNKKKIIGTSFLVDSK